MRVFCLIQSQGRDRIRLRQPMILDTWKRAKRRSSESVELMPPAGFQNYSSTASATTVFVFISMSARRFIYTFLRSSCRPISSVLPVVSQRRIISQRLIKPLDGRWYDRGFSRFSRACVSKVDIIFANGRIYNVSYFNLLKENGILRLVAAKRKRSEWFSKIRLLRPT